MEINNKKGIVFTLDGLIAIVIALIFISGAFTYIYSNEFKSQKNVVLNEKVFDILSIMEFNGILKNATGHSSNTTLNLFLDSLEQNICSKLEIFDKNNILLITSQRTGCTIDSDNFAVARRSFTISYDIYNAKMEASYK